MKQKLSYKFLCICLLLSMHIYAQETASNCNFNVNEAINYLEGSAQIERDSLKAIDYLKPCVEKRNSYAQLLMGRLLLHSKNKELYKKGFQLTKKAAKQNLSVGASDLGDLFKYGIGCELNYKKAKKWYKKAYKSGDAKGTYSLGYLHYKGLGNTSQNYQKAVKLFKQSDYPMAKHWLGVCYYFGYGVEKNEQRGLELLAQNPIENSEVMLDCMNYHLSNTQNSETKTELDNITILDEVITPNVDTLAIQFQGKWQGSIIRLDWSGKHVEQSLPVTINLSEDNDTINYEFSFNDKDYEGTAINEDTSLYFDNLTFNLKRLYFNSQEEQYVDYNISSGDFALKHYNNKTYLTAFLDSYVNTMKEPGTKFALILTQVQNETENGITISKDTALALAEQQGSFIKLYPNPFETDLYIAYTLENSGVVNLEVSDLHSTQRHILEQGKMQTPGNYTYYFNGASLQKGMNVITIYVDEKKHTKLIIKK